LTGVIGFGVYLFMTGRLQLPGQPAIPERGFNSEQPPAVAEQRVTLTAINSISERMTLEEVQAKLGVQLRLYSELSYSALPGFSNGYREPGYGYVAIVYSCILEDGSPFYLTFMGYAKPNNLVLVAKNATPTNLLNQGSSK
jgi:hypothetical protein